MKERSQMVYGCIVVGLLGVVALLMAGWLSGARQGTSASIAILKNSAVGAVIYGTVGFLSGALWPAGGWRWGLLLTMPLGLMLASSLLFAGYVGAFIRRDLPFLAVCVAMSCAAAYAGQKWRRR